VADGRRLGFDFSCCFSWENVLTNVLLPCAGFWQSHTSIFFNPFSLTFLWSQ
jgi:hypothetical protein